MADRPLAFIFTEVHCIFLLPSIIFCWCALFILCSIVFSPVFYFSLENIKLFCKNEQWLHFSFACFASFRIGDEYIQVFMQESWYSTVCILYLNFIQRPFQIVYVNISCELWQAYTSHFWCRLFFALSVQLKFLILATRCCNTRYSNPHWTLVGIWSYRVRNKIAIQLKRVHTGIVR